MGDVVEPRRGFIQQKRAERGEPGFLSVAPVAAITGRKRPRRPLVIRAGRAAWARPARRTREARPVTRPERALMPDYPCGLSPVRDRPWSTPNTSPSRCSADSSSRPGQTARDAVTLWLVNGLALSKILRGVLLHVRRGAGVS